MPSRSQASTHSRRRHVVRGAHGVAAHIFQHTDAIPLQAVGKRRAHAGVILMIAGAFDLHRLAVEKKSLVGIESDGAHPETHTLSIAGLSAGFNRHDRRIKVGSRRRPAFGIREVRSCGEGPGAVASDRLRSGIGSRNRLARSVKDLPAHAADLRLRAFVFYDCP